MIQWILSSDTDPYITKIMINCFANGGTTSFVKCDPESASALVKESTEDIISILKSPSVSEFVGTYS